MKATPKDDKRSPLFVCIKIESKSNKYHEHIHLKVTVLNVKGKSKNKAINRDSTGSQAREGSKLEFREHYRSYFEHTLYLNQDQRVNIDVRTHNICWTIRLEHWYLTWTEWKTTSSGNIEYCVARVKQCILTAKVTSGEYRLRLRRCAVFQRFVLYGFSKSHLF